MAARARGAGAGARGAGRAARAGGRPGGRGPAPGRALHLCDFQVEYDGTQQELFGTWAREAEAALGAKGAGAVRAL